MADAVCSKLDLGSGNGKLVFQTSSSQTVATLLFTKPAFAAASAGLAVAATISSDTNAAGGTIAKASAQDSTGLEVFNCAVTAPGGGGDIVLSSVVISPGQTVSLSGLTYTAPT